MLSFLWRLKTLHTQGKAGLLSALTLFGLLMSMFTFVPTAFANESIQCKNLTATTVQCRINEPRVTQQVTDYPTIVFRLGDQVVITADGCVQTGGHGKTWKRYVDPSGANSDHLYHGLAWIQGAVANTVLPSARVQDLQNVPFFVTVPWTHLRLGYEDDGYDDNGYYAHDDGTDGQCSGNGRYGGPAFVIVTIQHNVGTPIDQKYAALGGARGILGTPTSSEVALADGVGRVRHYQHGSIYWNPSLCAQSVDGPIETYWNGHGWLNSNGLGYPISDRSLPVAGSSNRYNDFENGVVYWQQSTNTTTALPPGVQLSSSVLKLLPADLQHLTGGVLTRDEVLQRIDAFLRPKLTSNSRIYVKGNPSITEITNYTCVGGTVHNRMYKVHYDLGVHVPIVSDARISLDLWIEINRQLSGRSIIATLRRWHSHVDAVIVSAQDINNQVAAQLNDEENKPQVVETIPASVTVGRQSVPINPHVLSIKVTRNGNLNVYIEPNSFGM